MEDFLKTTPVIDWRHPDVVAKAHELRDGLRAPADIAARCFEFVRDAIPHSRDIGAHAVPCSASETLRAGSGFCYSKSHLLAALLRANGVHAGFCYQRLSRDGVGAPYALHALNAVRLPGHGWYRVDARGNHGGIHASFTPPFERLAYEVSLPGEADFREIWPDPLPLVVESLMRARSSGDLMDNLPDVRVWGNGPRLATVLPTEPGRLPTDAADGGD
jgi:transglutaminase-like putative cysteine protease